MLCSVVANSRHHGTASPGPVASSEHRTPASRSRLSLRATQSCHSGKRSPPRGPRSPSSHWLGAPSPENSQGFPRQAAGPAVTVLLHMDTPDLRKCPRTMEGRWDSWDRVLWPGEGRFRKSVFLVGTRPALGKLWA